VGGVREEGRGEREEQEGHLLAQAREEEHLSTQELEVQYQLPQSVEFQLLLARERQVRCRAQGLR
jgi:uncharacterized protein (DUF427 family)